MNASTVPIVTCLGYVAARQGRSAVVYSTGNSLSIAIDFTCVHLPRNVIQLT
jgi:hypothetical protein